MADNKPRPRGPRRGTSRVPFHAVHLRLDRRRWNWLRSQGPDVGAEVLHLIDAAIQRFIDKWAAREERDVARWCRWRAKQLQAQGMSEARAEARAEHEAESGAAPRVRRAVLRLRHAQGVGKFPAGKPGGGDLASLRRQDLAHWLDELPDAELVAGHPTFAADGPASRLRIPSAPRAPQSRKRG